jgi:hypothetical protein
MKTRIVLLLILIPVLGGLSFGQKAGKPETAKGPESAVNAVKASPAFAEVLLLKTELESELEALIIEYTDEHPRVKAVRFELTLVQKDIGRLLVVKPADSSLLTLALGKMMVRRIQLESELSGLKAKYNDEHPDVKRAKRRVEIFEASIKEILG